MQHVHEAGPGAAARMAPEAPGHGLELGMSGLHGQIRERAQVGLLRAVARIAPEAAVLSILLVIGGTEQGAVPLLRERLPVQVGGRGRAALAGAGPAPVLMHDDTAEL